MIRPWEKQQKTLQWGSLGTNLNFGGPELCGRPYAAVLNPQA